MAFPSDNFSSSQSGRLQVVYSGQWTSNSGNDYGSGTLEMIVRCKLGSGGDLQTAILKFTGGNATATLERDYTGGSGNVPVALEDVSHTFSGPSSVGFIKCRIACYLIKR